MNPSSWQTGSVIRYTSGLQIAVKWMYFVDGTYDYENKVVVNTVMSQKQGTNRLLINGANN